MTRAIEVVGLGKQYRIGVEREASKSFVGALRSFVTAPLSNYRRIRSLSRQGADTENVFWALRDVDFSVDQGEVIGVIGRNGAGKSTLLKILSRITDPTTGSATIRGRIASLLEVGTGFHPELTGRENVYMNGTILGMTRGEISSKFDEIVEFSGVQKFIDTPVKFYSSGMKVRLGFAVAAHLEPDILIVDEVLAVGDSEFQRKAIGRMQAVSKNEGRTVLFVSHNLSAISNLCTRGLVLSAGAVVADDKIEKCLEVYSKLDERGTETSWQRKSADGKDLAIVRALLSLDGQQPRMRLRVSMVLQSMVTHKKAFVAVNILDNMGISIMQCIPTSIPFIGYDTSEQLVNVSIELPPLIPSSYFVSLWCGSHNTETFDHQEGIMSFEVVQGPLTDRTFPHSKGHGHIIPISYLEGYEG